MYHLEKYVPYLGTSVPGPDGHTTMPPFWKPPYYVGLDVRVAYQLISRFYML